MLRGPLGKNPFRGTLFGEVSADAGLVRGHGIGTFFPIHRTDFAVSFEVLEGIDGAEALADGASERHVVDDLVADDAFFIDEKEAAVGDEFAGDDGFARLIVIHIAGEDIVGFGDRLVDVCDERVGDALDTTLVPWGLEPCPVGEFGIRGAADDGDVAALELGELFLEAVEFGGADEGEILRVEEENDVFFPEILVEGEIFDDGFAFDGFCGEFRGWFTD